jgi:hypothetical protein
MITFELGGEHGGLNLTGHPDLMDCVDGCVLIGDWKTSFIEGDHANQLRAYAYLGILHYRNLGVECDRAWMAQLRVRSGDIISEACTWEQLQRWYAWAVQRMQEDTYNPSPANCEYCPRRLECPGRKAMLADAASVLCDMGHSDQPLVMEMGALDDGQLRHLYMAAGVLEKLAANTRHAIRDEVVIRGNAVPGLTVIEQERTGILMPEAWPLLEKRLGLNVLKSVCKVSKGDVEDVIRENAGYRQKASDWREFMAELDAAGVLDTRRIRKVEARPLPVPLEDTMAEIGAAVDAARRLEGRS